MTELAAQNTRLKMGFANFSLRRLLLCMFAIAIGLAIGQWPFFSHYHGFFAMAGVLIFAELWFETKLIASHPQLAKHDRRFHVRVRQLLMLAIVGFFVVILVQTYLVQILDNRNGGSTQRAVWLGRELFSSWSNAPEAMLQIAFFSSLLLGAPRRKPTRWLFVVLLCAVVWSAIVVYEYGTIMLLVQIAIEAMEVSTPGVQFGEISQYAVDSGTMYAGVEQDMQGRGLTFAYRSGIGFVAFLFCVSGVLWIGTRRPSNTHRRTYVATMLGLLVLAALYPIWVYTSGLQQLCPPYADAGIDGGIIQLLCGLAACVLVAAMFAYRSKALDDETPATVPQIHTTTLIATLVSCVAWLGLFDAEVIKNVASLMSWREIAETFAMSTNCYIALATMIVIMCELYRRAFLLELQPRIIGRTEPASMRVAFIGFLSVILIMAPTVCWLAYAVRIWLVTS